MHVGFELADAFRGEGVGDGLALAGVFCSVSGVEETALDGDEGVVEIPSSYQRQVRWKIGDTYDFKKPFPCPYISWIADSSATLTWFGWILMSFPYFSCASSTLL